MACRRRSSRYCDGASEDYRAWISVELAASENGGAPLWKDLVDVDAYAAIGSTSPKAFFSQFLGEALEKYARAVASRVEREDFQKASG